MSAEVEWMMPSAPMRAVADSDVLTDRTMRYNRNVMALAIPLLAIHLTSFFNFEHLSVFGLQIAPNAPSKRALVLAILWLALLYNAAWATYYCWRDIRRWLVDLTDRWDTTAPHSNVEFFPEAAMYFWLRAPRDAQSHNRLLASTSNPFLRWDMKEAKGRIEIVCWAGSQDRQSQQGRYVVSRKMVKSIRGTAAAVALHILPAAALSLTAIGAVIYEWALR